MHIECASTSTCCGCSTRSTAQRSVSRAAESLGLTQPAASHGLGRLRLLLADALFTRAPGGVAPTPRADRLAVAVQAALSALEEALHEPDHFEPLVSRKTFRIHMSDIGEGRFLPALMARLRELAPGVRVETHAAGAGRHCHRAGQRQGRLRLRLPAAA